MQNTILKRMVFKWFIRHQWKEMLRSSIWQKNVVVNIFLGIMVLLMMLYLLLLGLFIDDLLVKIFPDSDPIDIFHSALIYFFLFDLFFRYMMQALPTLSIEAYLHLPVKRSSIIHFVVSKSLINILNYLPLFVFVPFCTNVINEYYSTGISWVWMIAILFLILNNNFLATYIKRQMTGNSKIVGFTGLGLIMLIVLNRFGIISVSAFSAKIFNYIFVYPWLIVVPLLLLIASYSLNYYYLKSRLYPEEIIRKKKNQHDHISEFRYLKSLGITGDLLSLELKLLWRNKRTRSVVKMLPLFVLYGLFLYPFEEYRQMTPLLIFVGVFMSGGMMINYANYVFGWESNYFDNILSSPIDIKKYVAVKLRLVLLICTFCFIITIPYVFFDRVIFFINFVTYLYNIGLLSFLLLFMATYNKKRIDLSKGAAFNYQGIGASNWLAMVPAFLLPIFIYLPFRYFFNNITGIAAIGVLGLISLVFYRFWIEKINKNFYKRKHFMAEGFRSK